MGIIIFLAEESLTRWQEKVRRFPENPAEVKDDRIYNAHPVETSYPGTQRRRFALAKPNDDSDSRILVRVMTKWVHTRDNVMGSWDPVAGAPEDLVIGYGAHGDFKRVGCWQDGLILMSPGDVVCIAPEGGHKAPLFALFYEEKHGVGSMPFNDYYQIGEPHELAKAYEVQIKEAIAEQFSLSVDEFVILIKEDYVYFRRSDPLVLDYWCVVRGKGIHFLCTVTANIDRDHKELTDFSAFFVA